MSRKVIGSGLIFLGSGCGTALSTEQREYINSVKPDEFYPLELLLDIFVAVEQKRPELIHATGRRWGNAVRDEIVKRGAKELKEALYLIESVYLEHHQGDVGKLALDDDGENAVILTNHGPYPSALIAGAYEGMATAMGARDVKLTETDDPKAYRISWASED
jgi:hypothetical protein